MASISDQNWVVWNQGKNPLVNFNFMLRVELMFDLPCKSVRAFTRELEYDYIQEGGLNDYVHMRRKPITRPFTLEVERYVGVDYVDPLPLGADLVLPVLLFVSRNHDQFIPGVVARTYVFTGCTVMKKTYGDLVADQSGLLVETTTLGYREMLCVDIPWSEVGDNISKEIKTAPTNARSVDKTPQELKALGQSLYEQALAAKDQAQAELSQSDLEAILKELEETLSALRKAVQPGGSLAKRVSQAEQDRDRAGTLDDEAEAAAAAAQEAAEEKRRAANEKRADFDEKDTQRQNAAAELRAMQVRLEEPMRKDREVKGQIEALARRKEQAEEAMPPAPVPAAQVQKVQEDAQKAYDQALEELEAAKAEYDQAVKESVENSQELAQAQAQAALEQQKTEKEAAVAGGPAGEKLRQAEEACQKAKEHLNQAAADAQKNAEQTAAYERQQRELAQVDAQLQRLREQEKSIAGEIQSAGGSQLEKAQKKAEETQKSAQAAQEALDAANAELEKAQAAQRTARENADQKAKEARSTAERARKELNQAQTVLETGKKQVNPLQNSLTNLTLRKDSSVEALTNCKDQHDKCKKENDTLQKAPDDNVSQINTLYESVKKLSKQTCFHERQVRDVCQYMTAARKLLGEVVPLPEGETG